MENSQSEMSGKLTAFFSWIEFLGLIVFLSSRLFFRQQSWVAIAGLLLIGSGYIYRMYRDWKAGRKKAFWRRLIFLVVAIIAAGIVGYLAYERNA